MLFTRRLILGLFASLMLSGPAVAQTAADPENTLYLDLPWGRVVIAMRPDLAPNHVARIKELTRRGFYDGLAFHRVLDGFMAQTGDPKGDGTGGSELPDLRAEFSFEPHVRGVVSMARAQSRNSANSQFFIVTARSNHLNNKYTVWGRVIDGMEHVDRIEKGDRSAGGMVFNPTRIVKMQVAADVKNGG